MIRKILGLALPLVAFIAGAGAGDYLRGGTAAADESGHAVEAAGGEAAEGGGITARLRWQRRAKRTRRR